jgi:DNA-binding NarL/FixJ family response regulator
MYARPVLMLTHDDLLWQHWQRLASAQWMPARGSTMGDATRWRAAQRRLVMLDAGLPGLPRIGTPEWHSMIAELDVIVASLKPNDDEGRRMLAGGAKGYVHAYMGKEALGTALSVVAEGGVWLGASLLTRLLQQLERAAAGATSADTKAWQLRLTTREKEVAERAARGMGNQAIADELGITERTVRAHISAVFEKLGVPDRLMLALVVHGISQAR